MVEEYPDWASFTPEKAAAELPRLLADSEAAVAAIEKDRPFDYEGLVGRLDDATRALWRMWGAVSHMLSVMNSEAWRKVQTDWQLPVVQFSLRVSQSAALYDLSRAALAHESSRKPADATRVRILEKLVQGAELAGVGLTGAAQERYNAIQAELAQLGADFHNAVLDATAAFSFEKDGVKYAIDDAAYVETMKQCADREVRETLCRARATRAPENAPRIEKIRTLRREAAEILGFPDYVARSLAEKCAPSEAAVRAMIDELDAATRHFADEEERELAHEAPMTLQPWDRAYYAERLRERKYAYSEEDLKRYFPLEDVVAGLFRMTKFLFGVDVIEVSAAEKPPVWHPDVRFYSVCEKGETLAHFYFDPYVRTGLKSGGAWMNEFRNRSHSTRPLAVIVMNAPLPAKDGRCLLPFREVETLFHEFGHALQCMLTRIDEEDAAGINLVEWDAVEIASQFMENWCLDDRTGIAVPTELKEKVRAAKNFRAASQCRRQLAFAATDLDLHGRSVDEPADAVKKRNFARFGMPTVEGDRFLCAFTHIFAGGYAAGYYGYKWAEVMSADCFGAFEEAGLADDATVRALGQRYRETILALGGSKSALDVFRDFRGRDPAIGALLRQQGLQDPCR